MIAGEARRRRATMRLMISLLLVLGIVPGAIAAAAPPSQRKADPPDIILILTDDMTEADWRSLPETRERLPAIFPNYINTQPWCCPSRASILRGQYPHNHGTLLNQNGPSGGWESFRDQEDATIAVELQKAGYHTGLIGKYFNGYPAFGEVPPGWSYWFGKRDRRYFDWAALEDGQRLTFGTAESDYATDVIAQRTVAFIENAPANRPLFAYVGVTAPHLPTTVAPRHLGSCDDIPLIAQEKPSFNEDDITDKPAFAQDDLLPVDALIAFERDRQCTLKAVDELVVQVFAALETRGRPFDLIFASDNGFLLGEHRRARKNAPYEESIRTTMRAVGPDFPAGKDTRLVGNIDLAPTFIAIAGALPRADWDGRSIVGGLERQVIGIEGFGGPDEDFGDANGANPLGADQIYPPYQGFRGVTGIVYVEYEGGEVELYDLTADPYQLDNLARGQTSADFPAYHERVEALRNCTAASCWEAEDAPLE
jgi:arylsulfatase A-like enzyme